MHDKIADVSLVSLLALLLVSPASLGPLSTKSGKILARGERAGKVHTDVLKVVKTAIGDYKDVRGVRMYYEIHGDGPTVVLLHGGLGTIQTSFAKQIPTLEKNHRVIAIEQMGHGHTADVPGRELSYEAMCEDTALLLTQLGVRGADVIGWSDGGQLALRLAFTHPELVRRVVASGVEFGCRNPKAAQLMSAYMWPKVFREEYGRVSPDGPGHWPVFFEKTRAMWAKPTWGISASGLAKIQARTLIVAGDRDFSRAEESVRIFRGIPNAQLCILPGTGHTTFQDRPDWLNPIILEFLGRN